MTTGPIGSGCVSTDPLLVLLAQQIEVEHENQRHDDSVRSAARTAKLAAADAQVKALRDQADAIRTGAWASFALTTAGSAAEGVSIATAPSAGSEAPETDNPTQTVEPDSGGLSRGYCAAGRMLSGIAQPTKDLLGRSYETEAEARGVLAKKRADDAQSSFDGAISSRQKSEKHVEAMIDQVQRIIESARQAIDHVLSRF